MSFKSQFIRNILNKGLESAPTDVPADEVAVSGDAVVEIERLKKDNELQVEISALEQDVIELERGSEAHDELAEATEEVGELREAMESSLESGGLTPREAMYAKLHLNSIARRVGLESFSISQESFNGSTQDRIDMTVASLEGVKEFFSTIWEKIKAAWQWIVDKVKDIFGRSKEAAKEEKKNLEEAKEKVSKSDATEAKAPAMKIKKAIGIGSNKFVKISGKQVDFDVKKAFTTTVGTYLVYYGSAGRVSPLAEMIAAVEDGKSVTEVNAIGLKHTNELIESITKAFSENIDGRHYTPYLIGAGKFALDVKVRDNGTTLSVSKVSDSEGSNVDEKGVADSVCKLSKDFLIEMYDNGIELLTEIEKSIPALEEKFEDILKDVNDTGKSQKADKDAVQKLVTYINNTVKPVYLNPLTTSVPSVINGMTSLRTAFVLAVDNTD